MKLSFVLSFAACDTCAMYFPTPQGMLDEVGPKSVVVGGKVDENDKYVAPTVLRGECYLPTCILVCLGVGCLRCALSMLAYVCVWVVCAA